MGRANLAVGAEGRAETVVNRSRFIGLALPAATPDLAGQAVQSVRLRYPDASHHPFAWRAGTGQERASDDGEPQGTAGQPLLEALRRAEVAYGALVVVRYYGGRNLGRPGLYRAYLAAGQAALARAEQLELVWGTVYQLEVAQGARDRFLRGLEAAGGRHLGTEWREQILVQYWLPDGDSPVGTLLASYPGAVRSQPLRPEVSYQGRGAARS